MGMWDFCLKRTTLSILFPDGVTSITTGKGWIMRSFSKDSNKLIMGECEDELVWNNLLKDYAHIIMNEGHKPKTEVIKE